MYLVKKASKSGGLAVFLLIGGIILFNGITPVYKKILEQLLWGKPIISVLWFSLEKLPVLLIYFSLFLFVVWCFSGEKITGKAWYLICVLVSDIIFLWYLIILSIPFIPTHPCGECLTLITENSAIKEFSRNYSGREADFSIFDREISYGWGLPLYLTTPKTTGRWDPDTGSDSRWDGWWNEKNKRIKKGRKFFKCVFHCP